MLKGIYKLKDEGKKLGIALLAVAIVFKIAFYKEDFATLLSNVIALMWLFVLPGFAIVLYWKKEFDFVERFIVGTALGLGIMGILSYHIGLLGINIKYHYLFLPPILIGLGLFAYAKRERKEKNEH